MRPTPRIIATRVLYRDTHGARLTVTEKTVAQPDGSTFTIPVTSVQDAWPGAVCVITRGGRLLLGEHWRPSVEDWMWEFPRGMGEPGESAEQTARRECLEETGLQADRCTPIGTMHADTGLIQDTVHVVHVEVGDQVPVRTDGELTRTRWVGIEEFGDLVRTGQLTDSLTLSAFTLFGCTRAGEIA